MRWLPLLLAAITLFLSCNGTSEEVSDNPLEKAAQHPGEWTWIPMSSMQCRDGSETGLMARLHPDADQLVIFLQGGGACFDPASCSRNPASFGKNDFAAWTGGAPPTMRSYFDAARSPFADWNVVAIPYCTGDVHSGTNESADVPGGPQDQQMVGHANVAAALDVMAPFFREERRLSTVVLYGFSAGGFGTLINFDQVARAFDGARLAAIDHAGPILLDEDVYTPCLNERWRHLWQHEFPDDYDTHVQGAYAYPDQGIYEYLAKKHPDVPFGLVSSYHDEVIRWYYSFGKDGCPFTSQPPAPVERAAYREALLDLSAHLDTLDNWKVFYTEGNAHSTSLEKTVGGTTYAEWLDRLIASEAEHRME